MTKFTVNDLVDFVVVNRRGGKAFIEWSREQLQIAIEDALEANCLLYSTNAAGISGIVVGIKYATERVIYISGILTTMPGELKKFILGFNRLYPTWRLEADRRNKRRIYNTPKLIEKILKKVS